MGLKKGEKLTVFDLYLGLLVHSANDAAFVLADNYPGGVVGFIEAMNNKASLLGLYRTHFVNFDGEEDLNHFTTALDIARLSRILLKNELFSTIVELDSAVVRSIDGAIEHRLETTNQLLGVVPEIKGLKTGWTDQAGECFVSYLQLEKDGKTRRLVTVVLASTDRFGETENLLDWVKKSVFWRSVAKPLG
jgi:D-alanyl-D-alanine carboxypeptidase